MPQRTKEGTHHQNSKDSTQPQPNMSAWYDIERRSLSNCREVRVSFKSTARCLGSCRWRSRLHLRDAGRAQVQVDGVRARLPHAAQPGAVVLKPASAVPVLALAAAVPFLATAVAGPPVSPDMLPDSQAGPAGAAFTPPHCRTTRSPPSATM
jgi:hypothetical protein